MEALMSFADTAMVVAANTAPTTGEGLANTIRNFIAPLFLLALSIAALTFLWRRQFTEFLQFAALGVGIALLFYWPGVVESLARLLAGALGA